MKRPEHLPDYTDPPLDEVVLGVQFAPVSDYSSVHAMAVWDLFKAEFSEVQEHPILDPHFETFGGTNVQAGPQLVIGAPPVGSRLWFISENSSHLVQFQRDRFISNWRKRPITQPYPHFEGLAEAFVVNLKKLSDHLKSSFGYKLEVNQAEVSYINVIPVNEFSQASEWFKVWNGGALEIEGFSANFTQVMRDRDGKPFARLNHQLQSVFTTDGKNKAFRLSLMYRGKPPGDGINEAMTFLAAGREAIVTRFDQITTTAAQKSWGKFK